MKNEILGALFASILLVHSPSDAQSVPAKSSDNVPSSPIGSATTDSDIGAARPGHDNSQQAVAAPSVTIPTSLAIAPPADIASLTAKEILSANNQVVSHIATMYQNLGLFITIIVTLVGGVATWLSYIARKNVQEFISEWTKKLESIENEMKESLNRLRDAVTESEASAKKAAGHEQAIGDTQIILDKTLKDIDGLRVSVASLHAPLTSEQSGATAAQPSNEALTLQSLAEPAISAEEDANVTDRLKGKLVAPPGEGQ